MPDLRLSVQVSRELFGLAPLELNDHWHYYIAADKLFGGQVQWTRQVATGPYTDGGVTVNRTRQVVSEPLGVEVTGDDPLGLQTFILQAIYALMQDSFTVTINADGAVYAYQCEAADYQIAWSGPRLMAKQAQLLFTVPTQPSALVGA